MHFSVKYLLCLFVLCLGVIPMQAQFLGGAGSGGAHIYFGTTASCPWYYGGQADGHARAFLVNPDPCSYFGGGIADGHATIFLINPDTCAQYDGGIADGGSRAFLINPDTCGQYEGGIADGISRGFLANPVPCTAFFASQRDGNAFGYLSCTPLEVTASELFGRNVGPDGLLWWYTYSEVSNLGFMVQRSQNQLDWTDISFVEGQTNSNQRIKYELLDEEMQTGINYYRWQQIDFSGATSFSNIVALVKQAEASASLTIYPNPLTRGTPLNVNFQSPVPSVVTIQIIDGFGRSIWESDYPASEEMLQTQIPTDRLSAGVYFLILNTDAERLSRKVVVR